MYTTETEIKANNYRAKDRLIQTLVFLATTGPELDYLNDYIDQQNKLMLLSNRIIQTQCDMAEILKSRERLSEIASKAAELVTPDRDSIWAKRLAKDPMAVHNLFAQQAVTMEIAKEAYEQLMEEYKDDYDCRKEIQNQIDECDAKYQVFLSVTNLDTFKKLFDVLETRLKQGNKNGYKNLTREAEAAVDRINRAKQNVLFPVFNPAMAKSPKTVYQLYMEQYPQMLEAYNATVRKILHDNAGHEADQGIRPLELDGIPEKTTLHYFSLLLLIVQGRIMKSLSGDHITKYDAVELDCYFKMFCKAPTDVYLMNKIWLIMKDFVKYCIETWPAPKGK